MNVRVLLVAAAAWVGGFGTIALAAPTTSCNPQPWMRLVELYFPSPSRVAEILAAVADRSSNPALLDRLGDPLTAVNHPRGGFWPYLELVYNPVQNTAEIAANLRGDAAFARDFGAIERSGYSLCFTLPPAPQPIIVTEYYHPALNHYFLSSSESENQILDRGGAGPGWMRTGQRWKTYYPVDCSNPNVSKAVHRFYGPGPNSHFFTADSQECGAVRRGPGWIYEGIAFGAESPVAGVCPDNAPRPVYRVYNNRWMFNDSNHRYMTDPAIATEMVRQGWILEGVAHCLPDALVSP